MCHFSNQKKVSMTPMLADKDLKWDLFPAMTQVTFPGGGHIFLPLVTWAVCLSHVTRSANIFWLRTSQPTAVSGRAIAQLEPGKCTFAFGFKYRSVAVKTQIFITFRTKGVRKMRLFLCLHSSPCFIRLFWISPRFRLIFRTFWCSYWSCKITNF